MKIDTRSELWSTLQAAEALQVTKQGAHHLIATGVLVPFEVIAVAPRRVYRWFSPTVVRALKAKRDALKKARRARAAK